MTMSWACGEPFLNCSASRGDLCAERLRIARGRAEVLGDLGGELPGDLAQIAFCRHRQPQVEGVAGFGLPG